MMNDDGDLDVWCCRERSTVRRDEMLRNTYKNLFLLKRVNETTSCYRRDKYLNDWVVG